jgi:hypothetical protein
MLDDFAITEKWQGNERILDGRVKIYKLIRIWKSVPGNQLEHVKFVIKKRAQKPILPVLKRAEETRTQFAFCTLSPELTKTWNVEKAKRSGSKRSYVRRRLDTLASQISDKKEQENQADNELNRYASIKKLNKSKNSSIKKVDNETGFKRDLISLVKKQNELIDNTMKTLQDTPAKAIKIIQSKLANSIKKTSKKLFNTIDLNQKQTQEISTMDKALNKMDDIIVLKSKFIESLENELRILDELNGNLNSDSEQFFDDDKEILIGKQTCKIISKFASKSSIISSESGISSSNSEDQFETLV